MSLDKQIKKMAEGDLAEICREARKDIEQRVQGLPVSVAEVARLVSGHKTKTTENAVVKKLADKRAQQMLEAIMTPDEIKGDIEG